MCFLLTVDKIRHSRRFLCNCIFYYNLNMDIDFNKNEDINNNWCLM